MPFTTLIRFGFYNVCGSEFYLHVVDCFNSCDTKVKVYKYDMLTYQPKTTWFGLVYGV